PYPMYAPIARCTAVATHKPTRIGNMFRNVSDRVCASAMRFTRVAPRYTEIGGIAELSMPSSEYRTSDFGDADQASSIPWRRFLRTRLARPPLLAGVVLAVILTNYVTVSS